MKLARPLVMLSLFVGSIVVTACGPGAQAPDVLTQIAQVDLDLAMNGGNGFPEVVGPVLQAGTRYVYDVRGTYSIWSQQKFWANGSCKGVPAAAPIFASPDHPNGNVGVDAAFFFAIPVGSTLCDPQYVVPRYTSSVRVSLDGGATFAHVEPVGGRPAVPTADNTYRYEVTGEGEAFRARRSDQAIEDDYGVLRFTIYRVD